MSTRKPGSPVNTAQSSTARAAAIGYTLLLGILVLILHSPLQLPVTSDRAYLLYISQVAFSTGDIYGNSGFGYTPLAPLFAAAWFGLAGLVSDSSTVMLVRFAGMACWLACLFSLLLLGRLFFLRWAEALLMASIFAGFTIVPMMSAVNLEPKMLALLFQLLALASVHQRRYFLAGCAVSLAAMCWQPVIIIAPALALFLCFEAPARRVQALVRYAAGGLSGSLPVLIYLTVTRSWAPFWQQAVLRKLEMEGAVVLERPTHWLSIVQLPTLQSELWLFLTAGAGLAVFVLLAVARLSGRGKRIPRHALLMLLFTLAWSAFNSLEFQHVADLITLLPALCYWPAFLLWALRPGAPRAAGAGAPRNVRYRLQSAMAWTFGLTAGVLALHDLPRSAPSLTLAEQRQQLAPLSQIGLPLMTFDFEEFHVLNEWRLATKFVRYNIHDDYLIERMPEGGCDALIEQLQAAGPHVFALRLRGPAENDRTGQCAKQIIRTLANPSPIMELSIAGTLSCISCTPRADTVLVFSPKKRTNVP